jgi:hypothetical protein
LIFFKFEYQGVWHTCEYSARLLNVKVVVRAEDERDGAELEVEGRPAEGHPKGEEKYDRLGDEHIYI